MYSHSRRARGIVAIALVSLGATLALTGCLDTAPTHHSASPSTTPSDVPDPTQSTTPTSTPSPTHTDVTATPVTTKCAVVFTAQQVYDYNPNYVASTSYRPAAASLGAQVVAQDGRACEWLDETSNVKLDVGVAEPSSGDLATIRSTAAAGATSVALGASAVGYYKTVSGAGQLQVFAGKYWVTVSSAEFTGPDDASSPAKTVLAIWISAESA